MRGKKDTGWVVYILKCRNDALYTGITNNLDRRLSAHKSGKGSKYVRAWKPFSLMKVIPCETESEARILELKIKKMRRQEKIKFLKLGKGNLIIKE